MSIYNVKRKSTLALLMSFLPKPRLLEILKASRRLQKTLRIKPILYEIYSLKQSKNQKEYDLEVINEDDFTKRAVVHSLFEISNAPFLNGIGYTVQGHKKRISSMVKLLNGDIATISWDNTIRVWNLEKDSYTCTQTYSINREDIISSVIQLDTKRLLVSTWDKVIMIFNMKTREKDDEYSIEHFGKLMCTLIVDGLLILSSYDPRIKIWKLDVKKYIGTLGGHKGPVPCLILLSNGSLGSGSWDGSIKVWNLTNGECEMSFDSVNQKVIALIQLSNNKIAACYFDSVVKIWNINSKQIEVSFEGSDYLYQLIDGRIVTGLMEKEFQIVNPNTGQKEIVVKTNHNDLISGVMQLNDKRIVTSSFDKTMKIYGFVSKKKLPKEAYDYKYLFKENCLYILHKGY